MPAAVRPIPEGNHSVTPYLILSGASDAIAPGVEDPFGYRWFIATHKEDLAIE